MGCFVKNLMILMNRVGVSSDARVRDGEVETRQDVQIETLSQA